MIKEKLKSFINRIPYVSRLHKEHLQFHKNAYYPPGHYYSTIVSVDDIKERQQVIWECEGIDGITGIDLRTEHQFGLIKELGQYYQELPFTAQKDDKFRYYFENGFYSYTDAIVLYSMIRHFKPKKIIEVGSGFSSAVMLDTNEFFFSNSISLTFIEPYPNRLKSLIKETDKKPISIIESPVQQVQKDFFEGLNSGDILFIDSSHVAKTGSDVNYLIFEILPRLKSGVLIHFHDIFYPFEYPKEWVFKGRNWNEDYFVKAFLMYNNHFEIQLFSHYLHKHHKTIFERMPLCYKNTGGNLWLRKT